MRPSGMRQRAVVTYLSPAEAQVLEAARLLDGGEQALPRSSWLVARAIERLQTHAAAGERVAAGALAALGLERRLRGAARDGARNAPCRSLNPEHADHRIRAHADHRFRGHADHFLGMERNG